MRKTSGSRTALSWIIKTKLAPPQVGFRAVPRPRLIRESQRRLTLICAPPGFGKSTLMQELLTRLKSAAGKLRMLISKGPPRRCGRRSSAMHNPSRPRGWRSVGWSIADCCWRWR